MIMPSGGLQNAHFVKGSDRIYASGGRGLVSFRWDGTDIQEHVRISAGGGEGGGGGGGGGGGVMIFMAPEGDQALALVGRCVGRDGADGRWHDADGDRGREPELPVRASSTRSARSSRHGWDGKKVHYSIGNAHVIYDLERAKAFDDSVRCARIAAARRSADSTGAAGGGRGGRGGGASRATLPQFKPREFRVIVQAHARHPAGECAAARRAR